ncbi:hypothetical protein Q1695_012537 [Nippostrongylus brasiliensis]|nr:hypothetical protein Q1695_012537 [Nippostrongylus brasiliensis]
MMTQDDVSMPTSGNATLTRCESFRNLPSRIEVRSISKKHDEILFETLHGIYRSDVYTRVPYEVHQATMLFAVERDDSYAGRRDYHANQSFDKRHTNLMFEVRARYASGGASRHINEDEGKRIIRERQYTEHIAWWRIIMQTLSRGP